MRLPPIFSRRVFLVPGVQKLPVRIGQGLRALPAAGLDAAQVNDGGGEALVAQHGLDVRQGDLAVQGVGGRGPAEAVHIHVGQAQPFQEPPHETVEAFPVRQLRLLFPGRLADTLDEDVPVRVRQTVLFQPCFLQRPELLQQLHGLVVAIHVTGFHPFGVVLHQRLPVPAVDVFGYFHHLGREVDILKGQGDDLPRAASGDQRKAEEQLVLHVRVIGFQPVEFLQQDCELFRLKDGLLAVMGAGPLVLRDAVQGVPGEVAPADGAVQHRFQRLVQPVYGAGGNVPGASVQPLTVTFQAVQVVRDHLRGDLGKVKLSELRLQPGAEVVDVTGPCVRAQVFAVPLGPDLRELRESDLVSALRRFFRKRKVQLLQGPVRLALRTGPDGPCGPVGLAVCAEPMAHKQPELAFAGFLQGLRV